MDTSKDILMNIQNQINKMIVKEDLRYFPLVIFLLEKFARINNVDLKIVKSRDLKTLNEYRIIYGDK